MKSFSRHPSALALALLTLAGTAVAQSSPNVIVVLADDLGYGDIGPYDHDQDPQTPPVSNTPVLDQFAAQGARFTSFYATAPVCTPTRAALLTGRYPVRFGLTGVVGPNDQAGLPQSEITLAKLFRERGYRTQVVGKWHLGDRPQFHPLVHGFDGFFGVPYSNDMSPFYLQNGTVVTETSPDQRYLTRRFFDEARSFVATAASAGQPFFLYLPLVAPHVPVYVSPEFDGITGRGLYADCVREMDAGMGDLLADLAMLGIDQNTLVLVTSDNGPWRNSHGPPSSALEPWRWVGGSAGPLRGAKLTFFEGGVRVPCLARWPAGIAPGTVIDAQASCLDVFPTLADIVGAPLPADRVIDGRNIAPLLRGTGTVPANDLYFMQLFTSAQPGYGQWRVAAMRSGNWKVMFDAALNTTQLFDLASDLSESASIDLPALRATLQDQARGFQCSLGSAVRPPAISPSANLAWERPVTASSSSSCDSSRAAVDGLNGTAWTSAPGEAQWLAVDLGGVRQFRRVGLRWGALHAVSYAVESSLDGATWQPLVDVTQGVGGTAVHPLHGRGRYLRVLCRQSNSGAGYSLVELRVFGFDQGGGGGASNADGWHL